MSESLSSRFRAFKTRTAKLKKGLRGLRTSRSNAAPRARRGYGATTQRLEKLIDRLGYDVDFIIATHGAYLHRQFDCWRWEAWVWPKGSEHRTGTKLHIYSWETMTECVRNGIRLDPDDDVGTLCASPLAGTVKS